ncbi:putative dehydrogenase [Sphaerochaeta pleomorpha str. Grapes]|uniref:Putative dehydrogenase n=1 Tax=Sphaerochaeta pleomorpha (strain ATCC BAA-1885 / DSM 22778 / Grapes) TaxID=158190 RepID=G8QXN0_SPHPG|nr:Gfo/Idh/MocA family oxidoreductase [Sphaerochaeta pleomorpha]AEV29593.1 putative dehydrogenase [Sphaerochaeta pleomorpha str. Grapes]
MKPRILLVGIGGYGENYLQEVLDCPSNDYSVEGICDPYAARSARYEDILSRGIKIYENYDTALDSECTLVVIASPIHTHFEYMKKALLKGKDILCEKPPCIEEAELYELIELQRKSGTLVAIGYQMCYRPDIQALKKDIQQGIYGKPVLLKAIRLMRRGESYYTRNSWAGRKIVHGTKVYDSPFSNACAHDFQNMLFVLGNGWNSTTTVKSVEGITLKGNPTIENYDAVALCAKDVNGTPLYYYTAHCIKESKIGPFFEYHFSRAVIKDGGTGITSYDLSGNLIKDYSAFGQGDKLQKFHEAIFLSGKDRRPSCELETCKEHLRVIAAVQDLPSLLNIGARWEDAGDVFYPIEGLAKLFSDCYAEASLPSLNKIEETI